MKRLFLMLLVFITSSSIYSCTEGLYSENEQLYETQASGEDDGEVNDDPDS